MEKVKLVLLNGEIMTIEYAPKSVERTFDYVMEFETPTYLVKSSTGRTVPIKNILYYDVLENGGTNG